MKTTELFEIYKQTMKNYRKSAWSNGVNEYALELLEFYAENFDEVNLPSLQKELLNGVVSWHSYSWNGMSLIYNYDIAKRLCTPSELRKTRNGQRKPNRYEEWLDVQGRALFQAYRRIKETATIWTQY